VEDKKIFDNLLNLAIAGLISEAEFDIFSDEPLLKVEFNTKKTSYLIDIITDANLDSFIRIETNKGQFTIHSHPLLQSLKLQWYQNNSKIFSNVLDPTRINLQSIIISINLFGTRKLETISIPTSINKNYIKAVSYCIAQHLKVPVIPGTNQIKITNIPNFIPSSISEIPAIHSAELINFLTDKEKKKRMMDGALL
jgi:hypothetical protein